jgi:hypothetical protein
MEYTPTDMFTDEFELLSREAYVESMVHMHDIALNLLSQSRRLSPKIIDAQAVYVETLTKLLMESDSDCPLEVVQGMLPKNDWYPLFFEMAPLLEWFADSSATGGVYNA